VAGGVKEVSIAIPNVPDNIPTTVAIDKQQEEKPTEPKQEQKQTESQQEEKPMKSEPQPPSNAVGGVIGKSSNVKLDISLLPPEVVEALKKFDEDGNGLSIEDLELAAEKLNASKGMRDGFSLKAFPDDLQGTMKAFDQDGDGTVNKAELAAAARMYKESKEKVRMLGKIIAALSIVLLLTLLAIMGLVYVVVEMSKETSTGGDGVMTVKGSSEAVRVDTVESITTMWDLPATDMADLAYMKSLTVFVNMTHMPAVGGIAEATFKLASAYKAVGSNDKVLLTTNEGYTITIDGPAHHATIEMGTKGIFSIFTDKIADGITRRLRAKMQPKIPGEEEASEPVFFTKQAFLEEAARCEGGAPPATVSEAWLASEDNVPAQEQGAALLESDREGGARKAYRNRGRMLRRGGGGLMTSGSFATSANRAGND